MKKYFLYAALGLPLAFSATPSQAQFSLSVGISIRTAPPAIPVYVQPDCPADDYIWTPGYWAYGDDGYYWVPGVWVAPPQSGYLWTPGYWGYAGGIYGWHGGYWGPHVGYYGGVNYGYGYGGSGFYGGEWAGGHFRYNTAVVNVNRTIIHNTYVNRTVIINNNNRASFNGPGGVNRQPTPQEQSFSRENHVQPTSEQFNHNHTFSADRTAYASANHGRPTVTAMNRVGGNHFSAQGHTTAGPAVRPGGGAVNHPVATPSGAHPAGVHPAGNPGGARPGGNPGGAHPAGNPGGARPGGNPGGAHPAGNPGGARPAGNPGGVHPAGNPGGAHPNTRPAPVHQGGQPGGAHPAGNPGGGHPNTYHPAPAHQNAPAPHPAPARPAGNPGGHPEGHPGGGHPEGHPGGGEHHR